LKKNETFGFLFFLKDNGKENIVKKISTALLVTIIVLFVSCNYVWADDDDIVRSLETKCAEGDSRSCFLMGQRFRTVELDNKTALTYYVKACELNDMDGCNIGGILTQQNGLQNSKDWKDAFKLFAKACAAKHDSACANIGSLKYREGRQKAAIKYYTMACELGNEIGCANTQRLKR
jgi:TPR repeat protein